jgi:hypothetical protein
MKDMREVSLGAAAIETTWAMRRRGVEGFMVGMIFQTIEWTILADYYEALDSGKMDSIGRCL